MRERSTTTTTTKNKINKNKNYLTKNLIDEIKFYHG